MGNRTPFCFLVATVSGQSNQWRENHWERSVAKSTIRLEAYQPSELQRVRTPLLEGMQKETIEEPVQNVLMEEWEFLTSESWIASRLKRSFSAFLRAGAAAIELGGRGFDSLAAKTLKVPQFEIPKALKRARGFVQRRNG